MVNAIPKWKIKEDTNRWSQLICFTNLQVLLPLHLCPPFKTEAKLGELFKREYLQEGQMGHICTSRNISQMVTLAWVINVLFSSFSLIATSFFSGQLLSPQNNLYLLKATSFSSRQFLTCQGDFVLLKANYFSPMWGHSPQRNFFFFKMTSFSSRQLLSPQGNFFLFKAPFFQSTFFSSKPLPSPQGDFWFVKATFFS